MNLDQGGDIQQRFSAYVEGLASVIGRADRTGPLRDYCTGLMLPGERKSVEPMAARTAPARTGAQHQSLLHFVGNACWSDAEVLAKVREMVLPAIEKDGLVRRSMAPAMPTKSMEPAVTIRFTPTETLALRRPTFRRTPGTNRKLLRKRNPMTHPYQKFRG